MTITASLVKDLRESCISTTTVCIHLKLYTCLHGHTYWSLTKTHNFSMDFDRIIALFGIRKILVEILYASCLSTTLKVFT